MYDNGEVGEMAGLHLSEKEPDNAGAHAIMAEIYSSGGKRKEADKILALMKEWASEEAAWMQVDRNER